MNGFFELGDYFVSLIFDLGDLSFFELSKFVALINFLLLLLVADNSFLLGSC